MKTILIGILQGLIWPIILLLVMGVLYYTAFEHRKIHIIIYNAPVVLFFGYFAYLWIGGKMKK